MRKPILLAALAATLASQAQIEVKTSGLVVVGSPGTAEVDIDRTVSMTVFSRNSPHGGLLSFGDGADTLSSVKDASKTEKEYAYNPMVEEGKVWTYKSYAKISEDSSDENDEFYFQIALEGDTVIDGETWKQCWYRSDGKILQESL